jgi:hypothetical protein
VERDATGNLSEETSDGQDNGKDSELDVREENGADVDELEDSKVKEAISENGGDSELCRIY